MKNLPRIALVVGTALLYGLIARLVFTSEILNHQFNIVSWSFVILMPMAFGALTAFLGSKFFGKSVFWIYVAPILVIYIGLLASIITKLEAILCVVVAAPIMSGFALIGGILMGQILTRNSGRLPISFLVLLPFAASPVEELWKQPHQIVSIQDSIEITATPEEIWKQIVSVPPIKPEQIPFKWIYLLDFPKPISAEIDREGIGATRHAKFERGVSFYEVVTDWKPLQKLSFSIKADPKFIPHTAFDQHIIVGGRFYDVLDGSYEIEKTSRGCKLILTSTHRLATPFNKYAGLWSQWVMNQIQGSILTVIKQRAENTDKSVSTS
jgi:hypothetical protein